MAVGDGAGVGAIVAVAGGSAVGAMAATLSTVAAGPSPIKGSKTGPVAPGAVWAVSLAGAVVLGSGVTTAG